MEESLTKKTFIFLSADEQAATPKLIVKRYEIDWSQLPVGAVELSKWLEFTQQLVNVSECVSSLEESTLI